MYFAEDECYRPNICILIKKLLNSSTHRLIFLLIHISGKMSFLETNTMLENFQKSMLCQKGDSS